MKSMSMVDHGKSRLNCVCRCSMGFCNAVNPAIHILAGEKVCIHSDQAGALLGRVRLATDFEYRLRRGDDRLPTTQAAAALAAFSPATT